MRARPSESPPVAGLALSQERSGTTSALEAGIIVV